MDAIHVPLIVRFIADQVFRVMPLPDTTLPCRFAYIGKSFGLGQRTGKPALDQAPPRAEVRIVRRQRPDSRQMIRQDKPGADTKTVTYANAPDGFSRSLNFADQQVVSTPFQFNLRNQVSPGMKARRAWLGSSLKKR